jgi:ATP-dependent Clp endopeptidase proteolytic subunit ClpP
MKNWFQIKAKATTEKHDAEVFLYDEIGSWGVRAKDFIQAMKDSGSKRPLVRINSPGGDVFEGFAIYNFLRGLDVTVQIDGLAASMASVIALAGKEIRIASNGFFMVHNPWGVAVGDAEHLRDQADMLEKVQATLENTYAQRTGKPLDTIKEWMAKDTWFNAEESVAAGLASVVSDGVAFSASVRGFANVPAALLTNHQPAQNMNQLKEALAKAGLISSAELADEAAVAEIANKNSATADELAKLKAEHDKAAAILAEQNKAKVVAQVDAAITDGRIKAEAKDGWVAQIIADAKSADLLASISKPLPGAAPVGADLNGSAPSAAKKTLTEQCIEAAKARGAR